MLLQCMRNSPGACTANIKIKHLNLKKKIKFYYLDMDYYRTQCDDAVASIEQYMTFDDFVNCDPTNFMFIDPNSPDKVLFMRNIIYLGI